MKTIGDVGEFGLIDRIERAARSLRAPQVVLGIGDDAAILRPRRGEDLVLSADTIVEDVHFRFEGESPVRVGQRALLVNLSDLAAMGARPVAFTLALAAPPTLSLARFDGLLRGVLRAAKDHDCPLVGGNLTRARETSLAVTVTGAVARGRALRRHTVRAGDRLFVTGTLGGAALSVVRSERGGRRRGVLPQPRLRAGRALARLGERCACIDVSDGLLADLGHLLEAERLGASLDAERIPTPRGFAAACAREGVDPLRLALGGGEDYELLFALGARSKHGAGSLARRLGVRVSEIGRVHREPGLSGVPEGLTAGWRHF